MLAAWTGTPLDARNRGTPLAPGDVVCEIGDPARLEAVLIVDQADVEFLEVGQSVDVVCDAQPWQTHRGKISAIALHQLEATPAGLSVHDGGAIPSHSDTAGHQRPASPSYSVVVPLAASQLPPAAGLRGTARILVAQETLATRSWRCLCRTFRFEW
jgi:putative peptide zinc metalloprotease protein